MNIDADTNTNLGVIRTFYRTLDADVQLIFDFQLVSVFCHPVQSNFHHTGILMYIDILPHASLELLPVRCQTRWKYKFYLKQLYLLRKAQIILRAVSKSIFGRIYNVFCTAQLSTSYIHVLFCDTPALNFSHKRPWHFTPGRSVDTILSILHPLTSPLLVRNTAMTTSSKILLSCFSSLYSLENLNSGSVWMCFPGALFLSHQISRLGG